MSSLWIETCALCCSPRWKLLKWKEGGEDQGGRITDNKWPVLLETLREFTMESVTASRCLDVFVILSLLPLLISPSWIIKDTPGLQSGTTGKDTPSRARVRCPRGTDQIRPSGAERWINLNPFVLLRKDVTFIFFLNWSKVRQVWKNTSLEVNVCNRQTILQAV